MRGYKVKCSLVISDVVFSDVGVHEGGLRDRACLQAYLVLRNFAHRLIQ